MPVFRLPFKQEELERLTALAPVAQATVESVRAEKIRLRDFPFKAQALICTAAAAMATVGSPTRAFASTTSTLDITNISSICAFIGNFIQVVGLLMAAWYVVQVFASAKEQGGLQFDKNVWGAIGGIGMAVAGGAIKAAGDVWAYGPAA